MGQSFEGEHTVTDLHDGSRRGSSGGVQKPMGRVHRAFDAVIVVLCLPFYAITTPLVLLFEWLLQRRSVRIGMEVTHWPSRDVREDYVVVDVSRIDEGLVGIHRRLWGTLGAKGPPPYPEHVEFIRVATFWVPEPFFSRRNKRSSPGDQV